VVFNFFLETTPIVYDGTMELGAFMAFFAAFFAIFLVVGVAFWLYFSFAFMSLAKKNNQDMPGLAWIPGVGPMIVAYRASGMHWWPWLLLIGLVVPYVGFITGLIFMGFFVAWNYKLFEAVGKPGWWAILMIIPAVNVVYLVLLGVAAWSK
jgi:uncharacterized membrane protein YhaH (DUF805 family)